MPEISELDYLTYMNFASPEGLAIDDEIDYEGLFNAIATAVGCGDRVLLESALANALTEIKKHTIHLQPDKIPA